MMKDYTLTLAVEGEEEPDSFSTFRLTDRQAEILSMALGALWNGAVHINDEYDDNLTPEQEAEADGKFLQELVDGFNHDAQRWLEAIADTGKDAAREARRALRTKQTADQGPPRAH